MAEELKKGVIVEFDFAVANGAELLYETADSVMREAEVPFNKRIEVQHFVDANYLAGVDEYFRAIKAKKTAAKTAKDLQTAFADRMTGVFPRFANAQFKEFVMELLSRNLRVIVSSRADPMMMQKSLPEFAQNPNFILYSEIATTYGSVKWDAWRHAAATNHQRSSLAFAVAGSGFSVKGALFAGMGAVAVINKHVEWQDFSGADALLDKVDGAAAALIAKRLRA